jgi:hypothetical protein
MRGADTFTESPFALHRLEDFVPQQSSAALDTPGGQ